MSKPLNFPSLDDVIRVVVIEDAFRECLGFEFEDSL